MGHLQSLQNQPRTQETRKYFWSEPSSSSFDCQARCADPEIFFIGGPILTMFF